jgi:hypothetical protein
MYLEKIRDLPDDLYESQRDLIIEKIVEKTKLHLGVFDEFDEDREYKRMGDLLDRTRKMSDVDFALHKESMALEWKGKTNHEKRENDVLLKIRYFLLDPVILKHL